MLAKALRKEKTRIVLQGVVGKFTIRRRFQEAPNNCFKPKSSDVLRNQLKQRNYPHWTAW